jgi:hypothetical protein
MACILQLARLERTATYLGEPMLQVALGALLGIPVGEGQYPWIYISYARKVHIVQWVLPSCVLQVPLIISPDPLTLTIVKPVHLAIIAQKGLHSRFLVLWGSSVLVKFLSLCLVRLDFLGP